MLLLHILFVQLPKTYITMSYWGRRVRWKSYDDESTGQHGGACVFCASYFAAVNASVECGESSRGVSQLLTTIYDVELTE